MEELNITTTILFLIAVFALPVQQVHATEPVTLDTKVISVYDGDTFTIETKDQFTNKSLKVRIRNIDTAELGWRGNCIEESVMSKNAKDYLEQLILNKTVHLVDLGKDKYGRLLADVFLNNINIGQDLITKKYAVTYKVTDKKPIWCDILKNAKPNN